MKLRHKKKEHKKDKHKGERVVRKVSGVGLKMDKKIRKTGVKIVSDDRYDIELSRKLDDFQDGAWKWTELAF